MASSTAVFGGASRCLGAGATKARAQQGPCARLAASVAPNARAASMHASSNRGFLTSPSGFRAPIASKRPILAATAEPEGADVEKQVAMEGDLVEIHFIMRAEDGTVLQNTYEMKGEDGEDPAPIPFEVGAGDVVGNPLFQGFDEAVRGMTAGDTTSLTASGGEWKPELLFEVPMEHPEMQRLQGRYKSSGGIVVGEYVELSNGGKALVLEADDKLVKMDANNMLAGTTVEIELTLVAIGSA